MHTPSSWSWTEATLPHCPDIRFWILFQQPFLHSLDADICISALERNRTGACLSGKVPQGGGEDEIRGALELLLVGCILPGGGGELLIWGWVRVGEKRERQPGEVGRRVDKWE